MNRLSGISRLVGCVNGSKRGLSLAVLPAAILGARMMNTAGGGARDYEKGQDATGKDVDVGAIWPEKKIDTGESVKDSWESFQIYLLNNPSEERSVKELWTIFESWCAHFNKRYASAAVKCKKFVAFKQMMYFADMENLEAVNEMMYLADMENMDIEIYKYRLSINADLHFSDFRSDKGNNFQFGVSRVTLIRPPGDKEWHFVEAQHEVDNTEKEEISWESFQENLKNYPKWRSEEEVRTIFKRWCAHWEKGYDEVGEDRAFGVFKVKMRLTDEYNAKTDGDKMDLDCFSDKWSYCVGNGKGSF